MRLQTIKEQLLPPFFFTFKLWIYHKIHPISKSPLPQILHNSSRLVILGNGPSLNDSIVKYKKEIMECDRMVVNFFASTDLYETLRPNLYVLADPAFFNNDNDAQSSVSKFVQNLVKKTSWEIKLILPHSAKGAPLLDTIEKNHYISIIYYNNINQYIGNKTKFWAWDKNLLSPPAQNVLNVCVYLSLFWGYPETYLIGADSSFLEEIRIDQETNEIYCVDSHFYQRENVYSTKDQQKYDTNKGLRRPDRTVATLVSRYCKMFANYEDLRAYADYKGLKVYNASEYSWIDCFERKKLDTIE